MVSFFDVTNKLKIIWDKADGKGKGCSYSARVKIKIKLVPNIKFVTATMYDFGAQTQKVEPLNSK